MTRPTTVTVERLDGRATRRAEDDVRLIYTEAFAEPPYQETQDEVAATFRRLRAQTRKVSFRAALARTEAGEPVAMAYGHALSPDTDWWDLLVEPVPDAMRHEDDRRTFGLMELAVRRPWRGKGIARRLHATLLIDTECERVLLNVHPGNEAASAAYRSWGYRKIGQARPWEGADLHDVLLLDLTGAPRAGTADT